MRKETIVAITDAGGRGAALPEAYTRSEHVDKIFGIPGKQVWELNTGGNPAISYPDNPNGSMNSIAGVATENILGLMPHPERLVLPFHDVNHRRGSNGKEPFGRALFRGMVNFASQL